MSDLGAAQAADALHQHLLDLAHEIIDAGFDVLIAWAWARPSGGIGKSPAFYHGHLDAHHDKALIAEQLSVPPHRPAGTPDTAQIVVAFVPGSGGHGVFDFDVKDGKPGAATYELLAREHTWRPTAAWRSPSGGANVLFAKPPDALYSNRSPWPGVDVRSDNGWVVAPGNEHVGAGWHWIEGDFKAATPLPGSMTALLTPSNLSDAPRATPGETVRFIEASPGTSSFAAMQAFGEKLHELSAAKTGSRHDAMHYALSWAFGMEALDLRHAMAQVKDIWEQLTAGEGRGDEVDDAATWIAGKEIAKRATTTNGAAPPSSSSSTPGRQVHTPSTENVIVRRVRWLWNDRIPLGALTLLGGREGIGKSILAYTLAAKISTGQLGGELHGKPRRVVIAANEDSWEHTIAPRLIVAGADLTHIHRLTVTAADGQAASLTLPYDIGGLHQAAVNIDAALVLLDPIISRLDAALDTHRDAEVRQGLEPLSEAADRGHYSILGLIHVNKGTSNDPLTMLMASRAFAAVARSVLFTMLDPEQPGMRLLGEPKNNLGRTDLPTLLFDIVEAVAGKDPDDGLPITTGKMRWLGDSKRSILDALHDAGRSTEARSQQKEAEDWLSDFLNANPVVDSRDIKAAAAGDYSERTLKRAREAIGAPVSTYGFPRRTAWSKPGLTPDEVEKALVAMGVPSGAKSESSDGGASDKTAGEVQ
jgi:hypothetical protein